MLELIKGIITGCVILVGAFFVTLAIDLKEQHDLQQEAIKDKKCQIGRKSKRIRLQTSRIN